MLTLSRLSCPEGGGDSVPVVRASSAGDEQISRSDPPIAAGLHQKGWQWGIHLSKSARLFPLEPNTTETETLPLRLNFATAALSY